MIIQVGNAIMNMQEFSSLPEYSCTLPSGTTTGKRWKCNRGKFFHECLKEGWLMGEYQTSAKPGCVDISWTRIVIIDMKYPGPNDIYDPFAMSMYCFCSDIDLVKSTFFCPECLKSYCDLACRRCKCQKQLQPMPHSNPTALKMPFSPL